jgi:hypothetical protein
MPKSWQQGLMTVLKKCITTIETSISLRGRNEFEHRVIVKIIHDEYNKLVHESEYRVIVKP